MFVWLQPCCAALICPICRYSLSTSTRHSPSLLNSCELGVEAVPIHAEPEVVGVIAGVPHAGKGIPCAGLECKENRERKELQAMKQTNAARWFHLRLRRNSASATG